MTQTSKPLTLSIVIPAYNEADYLAECLDSIAGQLIAPDEVIVVDNNSTDSTANIAALYPFVRVITAKKQGVVHARNAGFDAATGDIIGRIDADTQLSPTWTMQVKESFAADVAVQALTGRCYFYDFPFWRIATLVHEAVYYKFQCSIAGTEILWGSNMAIRASAWHVMGRQCMLSNSVPEDIELSLIMQKHGSLIVRKSNIEAAVSLRRGQISPKAVAQYLKWWPQVYYRHKRFYAAAMIGAAYLCICLAAYIFWLVNYLVTLTRVRISPEVYTPET